MANNRSMKSPSVLSSLSSTLLLQGEQEENRTRRPPHTVYYKENSL